MEGEVLGAELFQLWSAGAVSLPKVANVYAQASRDLHNTSWNEDGGFNRSGVDVQPGGELAETSTMGEAYAAWHDVRTLVQYILADTADALFACGDVLCAIAADSGALDDAAGDELTRLQDDLADAGGLVDQPPGLLEKKQPKRPGDPHDTTKNDRPDWYPEWLPWIENERPVR